MAILKKVATYYSTEGYVIEEFELVEGEFEQFSRFRGQSAAQVQTSAGPQVLPFSFDVPAENIQEAMEKFPECCNIAGKEISEKIKAERAKQSKIVTPDPDHPLRQQPRPPTGPNMPGVEDILGL